MHLQFKLIRIAALSFSAILLAGKQQLCLIKRGVETERRPLPGLTMLESTEQGLNPKRCNS